MKTEKKQVHTEKEDRKEINLSTRHLIAKKAGIEIEEAREERRKPKEISAASIFFFFLSFSFLFMMQKKN